MMTGNGYDGSACAQWDLHDNVTGTAEHHHHGTSMLQSVDW